MTIDKTDAFAGRIGGALPTRARALLRPAGTMISPGGRDWSRFGIHGFNSRDRRSRPFNLLRSQVIKIMTANNWRTLGITSATPQVGKSFIAANLAASLSRVPTTETLLFDLDLRRGSIAKTFGIQPGTGVEAYLAGEIDALGPTAHAVEDSRLTIYPAFVADHASAELLAGPRMGELTAAMRGLPGDVLCLCDLPPAFANDDAAIVLRAIDAYLFVVEEGRTTARQIRDAMSLLAPAPCIGTVLNRYNGGVGGDDYGFGYGSQRGYDAYYS